MFNFLSKKFVKDYKNYTDQKVRLNLISLSGLVGIIINFILFAMKISIGLITSSSAVLGDAFNNLSDALTSLITLVGAKVSNRPADKGHPWGHGRGEYIASFVVGIFIMYVGIKLLTNSLTSFVEGNIPKLSLISIVILIVSIFFKLYIYFLNESLEKKLDSKLNFAVKVDARNDIISTILIIIVVSIQKYINFNLDSIIGIFLALVIFMPGLELFVETVDTLLGKKLDPDLEKEISAIILEGDFVVGFHNLQIHEYGKGKLVGSCDLEVPENLTVGIMHESISRIEDRLRNEVGIDITCHMDPTYTLVFNKENIKKIEKLGHSNEYGYKDFNSKH
ncbi:MAG: cation diffusion facilitator family transporter [Peptoniphilaceae bacterium]|nr:cation diffusion facilitator family transporter [Peptoniphilaceae bacterium]MDY6019108.1 cation diffusion facilitator family transporter [Anaerococcus sp.]